MAHICTPWYLVLFQGKVRYSSVARFSGLRQQYLDDIYMDSLIFLNITEYTECPFFLVESYHDSFGSEKGRAVRDSRDKEPKKEIRGKWCMLYRMTRAIKPIGHE